MALRWQVGVFLLMFSLAAPPGTGADGEGGFADARAGIHSALQERGITAEAAVLLDFLYNTHGGIKRDGTILGNFDLVFEVDTEKLGAWSNGTFFLYLLGNWNFGGLMSEKVGDLQVTSNIEAPETMRLYEAWYEHRFAADRLSFLFGLHDFNSEFDVIEYGGSFINSSFGISPDISQSGPSIFPSTALAARVKVQPSEGSYIMAAVYDGVPGDPNHPKRTTIKLKKNDGVFAALEAGLARSEPEQSDYFKLGAGTWLHTAKVENFAGEIDDRNFGFYLIGEKKIFSEFDEAEGLGAFVQFGFADEDRNQIAYYWGAGLQLHGADSRSRRRRYGPSRRQRVEWERFQSVRRGRGNDSGRSHGDRDRVALPGRDLAWLDAATGRPIRHQPRPRFERQECLAGRSSPGAGILNGARARALGWIA